MKLESPWASPGGGTGNRCARVGAVVGKGCTMVRRWGLRVTLGVWSAGVRGMSKRLTTSDRKTMIELLLEVRVDLSWSGETIVCRSIDGISWWDLRDEIVRKYGSEDQVRRLSDE